MGARPGSTLLIQFAREPVAGAVKTRMVPHLSPGAACALHCELVLRTCGTLVAAGLGRVELAVAGNAGHPLFERCRALGVAGISAQRGRGLGARMYRALQEGLGRFERVVLVGSDCPGIDRDYLARALDALDRAELVLGPAMDGGYVLVGCRRVHREMFAGIPWGTASVYAETANALRQLGIEWETLPPLADIDRPEDLPAWMAIRGA